VINSSVDNRNAMSTALTLRSLPTLLTDCVLVGHARKADVVFTPRQWFGICTHMMNDNPANFFLMPYLKEGRAKYSRAFKADAQKRMLWAWETITGKAKSPASIGFYPTNSQRQSRWAGMDFDAHDGHTMRARDLALKAFQILYRQPDLFIALTTSAGDPQHTGWHLFIFSRDFHPCEDWTRLLKQIVAQIGATVQDGIVEIFPNEFRGIGKALRAPGTWNPKTGDCGLIVQENLSHSDLLPLPCGGDKKSNALYMVGELRGNGDASSHSSEIYRGEHREWATVFAITAPCTRHEKLTKLVGTGFFQAGKAVLRKNAELQHREATPPPSATVQEHLQEFDEAWSGMDRKWKAKLSSSEREKIESLTTETQYDAFRIVRNWSQTSKPDFKIHCESLARRLGISLKGASQLRFKFCKLGILWPTAPFVPHKRCARFEWIAAHEPKRKQETLISPPQWNGDPCDACPRK
jgi:hypothetical protein